MNKLIKCEEEHRETLLEYLKQEAVRNTFLIGDIMNYGFGSEMQQVWMDMEEEACQAVYLWFCNNLLIYSHKGVLNAESIALLLGLKVPDQVMAKSVHLQQMHPFLEGYQMKSKTLLALIATEKVFEDDIVFSYRKGTLEDVDRIYEFLQSGELAPLYRSREMIEKRIETGEGVHLLVEEGGEIIAHVNSAATTPYSTMIGGLFTRLDDRGKGLGSFLTKCISREIIESNRIPCLISAQEVEHNLLYNVGFEKVEEFTTLEPK